MRLKHWLPRSLIMGALFGVSAPPLWAADAGRTHQVRAGDSLSKLSKQYLGDVKRWRELWALNPQIRTPSELTVGQQIRLPAQARPAAPEAPARTSEPTSRNVNGAPLHLRLLAQEALASGQLDTFPERYRIATSAEIADHLRIEAVRDLEGSRVILASGFGQPYRLGTHYALYRTVRDLGKARLLQRVGQARLMAHEGDLARLDLESLTQEDLSDLFLLPLWHAPTLHGVTPQASAMNLEARILKVMHDEPEGYFVLLDRGLDDQLQTGDLLSYFKKDFIHTQGGRSVEGPTRAGGTILIFHTTEGLSLGKVISAQRLPAEDDRVLR